MDDSDKNKLKDVLSTLDPVEFKWDNDMSTETGVIAQEIGAIMPDGTINTGMSCDTITINTIDTIDLGNISITGAGGVAGGYFTSAGANGSSWNFSSQPSISIGSEHGKSVIKTAKHEIDLDELGDVMATLKKRLLILTPNFEMHEKYPMLKELYDEYKAMERLLGGPDTEND